MKTENQIVICAIAKQEYDFLYDWCAWHLRLGFDKIYLYDNNDPDGESYDELLKEFIDNGKLEIRDCRGEKGVQIAKYNEFYKEGNFKWCSFIDIDEFFYFKPTGKYNNIKDFLKMKRDADVYMLLWECYGSAGLKKDGHIWDNCKKLPYNVRKSTDSYLNFWHKSIVRSGIGLEGNEHTISNNFSNYKVYNEKGERLYSQLELFDYKYDHNNINLCINHYLLRDIDTFFYKKYLRGHAGIEGSAGIDGWTPNAWNQNINYFIDTQRFISNEDQEYLYSKGMRPDWKFHPTIIVILHLNRGNSNYFNEIINIVNQIRQNNDCITQIIFDSEFLNENHGNIPEYNISKYNLDNIFNYDKTNECQMWDSPGQYDTSIYDNYFIQTPLILHIGFPLNNESIPYDFFNNLEYMTKDLCFFNQKKSILYTPKILVENDINDNLYLSKNLEYNIRLYHKRFKNNIFLTTFDEYNKITQFYKKFDDKVNNEFIIECNKELYATSYNQYNYLWPGLIDNIIEV